ncbi:LysR family transcriptional regulator [Ramlibacter rhizophilus]|uniref:LysR family transcriptional regulator n=1 Tax=Ramlibacter rhizophilus TaxID=1781167 RepID=A0A4Z0BS37_9BURK|nr:LysR family transcriptional regulator [Ramlibacter rhizophilus]TFZ01240.1 LysR family transcriptional regulator [Ramlibacter rhizophilus]
MDTLDNLRAFALTARAGSFSAAARQLDVATSVVTKRIGQLEHRVKARLFNRSTRGLQLTEEGRQHLAAVERLLGEAEGLLSAMGQAPARLQGRLRIKVPSTFSALVLGDLLLRFQKKHPELALEVAAFDRPVNPLEEGYDLALTMSPLSYAAVAEHPLAALERVIVAAPRYLRKRGTPRHPRDLLGHDILNYQPMGNAWSFEGPEGTVSVELSPRLASNDGQLLLRGAIEGLGITALSGFLPASATAEGLLQPLLPAWRAPVFTLKALVPQTRADSRAVAALVSWLRSELPVRLTQGA